MTNLSSGSKRAWEGSDHLGSAPKRPRERERDHRDDSARDWRDVHLRLPGSRKPPPVGRDSTHSRRPRPENRPRSRSRDRDYRRSSDYARDRDRRDYRDRDVDRDYRSRRDDSRRDGHSPAIRDRDRVASGSTNGRHDTSKLESEKEEGE